MVAGPVRVENMGGRAVDLQRSLVADPDPAVARILGGNRLAVCETRVPRAALPAGELRIGLRPEAVRVARSGTKAKVELVERLGERTLIYARLADGQPITAEDSGNSRVRIGDETSLKIDGSSAHVFDADGAGYHRADS